VKIAAVAANNRRRAFEVRTRHGTYRMPYAMLDPGPSLRDRVRAVRVDPELGNEAFTYVLESGREGSVHLDSVLAYDDDPELAAELVRDVPGPALPPARSDEHEEVAAAAARAPPRPGLRSRGAHQGTCAPQDGVRAGPSG
jgi:hypothetical protein